MLDQITINKFIAGDVKAFERLFRKYARSMQLVALGLYRDTAVAEDAVQESFVYLWNHRKEMKPDIAIEGYLYTFVRKNNKYNYGTTSFYTKGNKRLFT